MDRFEVSIVLILVITIAYRLSLLSRVIWSLLSLCVGQSTTQQLSGVSKNVEV